jgi:hypothetical protein
MLEQLPNQPGVHEASIWEMEDVFDPALEVREHDEGAATGTGFVRKGCDVTQAVVEEDGAAIDEIGDDDFASGESLRPLESTILT